MTTPTEPPKTAQEAIDRAIAERADEVYIPFDGQNCDDCAGWDMEDRRCECGNRRVSWDSYQMPDGTWVAYASAY